MTFDELWRLNLAQEMVPWIPPTKRQRFACQRLLGKNLTSYH